MNTPLRIAVITASVREGRGGPIFGSWMAEQAEAYGGLDVELIDLADHEIPLSLPAESPKAAGDDYPRPDGQRDLTEALEAADGFVVVTPEYNHSYPASLKSALDWHFTQWQAKPVALVSYGGDSGGRHAALHLENVLTELHAHPAPGASRLPALLGAPRRERSPQRPGLGRLRQGHARPALLVGRGPADRAWLRALPRMRRRRPGSQLAAGALDRVRPGLSADVRRRPSP